jgi:hypothetical protein
MKEPVGKEIEARARSTSKSAVWRAFVSATRSRRGRERHAGARQFLSPPPGGAGSASRPGSRTEDR